MGLWDMTLLFKAGLEKDVYFIIRDNAVSVCD